MSSARKKGASARGGASARAGAKKDKKAKAGKKAAPGAASGGVGGAGHGEYSQLGLLEVVQKRFLNDVFDQAKGKSFQAGGILL